MTLPLEPVELSVRLFLPAYIGPGLAGGALAILAGLVTSVALAVFVVVWYPVKRLLRLGRKPDAAASENSDPAPSEDAS